MPKLNISIELDAQDVPGFLSAVNLAVNAAQSAKSAQTEQTAHAQTEQAQTEQPKAKRTRKAAAPAETEQAKAEPVKVDAAPTVDAAPKAETEQPKTEPKAEPKAEPAPVDLDALRTLVRQVSQADDDARTTLRNMVHNAGVAKLGDMPATELAAFAAKAQEFAKRLGIKA